MDNPVMIFPIKNRINTELFIDVIWVFLWVWELFIRVELKGGIKQMASFDHLLDRPLSRKLRIVAESWAWEWKIARQNWLEMTVKVNVKECEHLDKNIVK